MERVKGLGLFSARPKALKGRLNICVSAIALGQAPYVNPVRVGSLSRIFYL